MGASDRARHVEPITVRWGDLDSFGHVNNARYFTYCESARMTYFAAIGMNDHRETALHGPALAAANLNFRQQVRWPAELEVATRVSEIGRSSFRMEYEIFHRGTGDRVADGAGVIVWVDYGTGKSSPLPEGLKAAIRGFEGMSPHPCPSPDPSPPPSPGEGKKTHGE